MHFNMIHVGAKESTVRRAIAQGVIQMSSEAFIALRDGTNPKGNVLALAEVAGIMAAKKASELIPLCHPMLLDQVKVSFALDEKNDSVLVLCEASTTAKTGVEMEALSGVNGALLSIYDLCKAINPCLTISDIRLNFKEGGKKGKWVHPKAISLEADSGQSGHTEFFIGGSDTQAFEGISVSVITISDRVSMDKMEDTSGPAITRFFEKRGAVVQPICVVPDERSQIQMAVNREIRENRAKLVITTGGTGLGPRDVTPEAIEEISDRLIPGFGELLRSRGAQHTPFSWLSRSLGAFIGDSVVIALPGSAKAVIEGLRALENILPHALETAKGRSHELL